MKKAHTIFFIFFLSTHTFSLDKIDSNEDIQIGKMLFFDNDLSKDRSLSCASCHNPDLYFTDGKKKPVGIHGKLGKRNTPTIVNLIYSKEFFLDGREKVLERQVLQPIIDKKEMGFSYSGVLERINKNIEYKKRFKDVYDTQYITLDEIGKSLAAYIRSLVDTDSRFDDYLSGEIDTLTDSEVRGMLVFQGKGRCAVCHSGINFSDKKYHNLGFMDDYGRYLVTRKESDKGAFKTPTLRGLKSTSPYFHNGSKATLQDVVRFYNDGGGMSSNKSDIIKKLDLTEREQKDLIGFLLSLD